MAFGLCATTKFSVAASGHPYEELQMAPLFLRLIIYNAATALEGRTHLVFSCAFFCFLKHKKPPRIYSEKARLKGFDTLISLVCYTTWKKLKKNKIRKANLHMKPNTYSSHSLLRLQGAQAFRGNLLGNLYCFQNCSQLMYTMSVRETMWHFGLQNVNSTLCTAYTAATVLIKSKSNLFIQIHQFLNWTSINLSLFIIVTELFLCGCV